MDENKREQQESLNLALDGLHNYLKLNNGKDLDGFYSVIIPKITFDGMETTIYRFNLKDFSYEIISQ